MTNLEKKGSITKRVATFYAFCASYAQIFINLVLEIGFLYESTVNCAGGAQLVLSAFIQFARSRLEIAEA